MSWLFSRALVEEFLAEKSLDGEPFARLSVISTPHPFWHRDRVTDISRLSQFGLTYQVLTGSRGEELLTWFREGFRAKTYQLPEKGQESTASDQDCGESSPALLAKFDPATSSWKTAQPSLLEDWEGCLVTFPRWGSMRSGGLYQRRTWVPRTLEREYGFVPDGVTFHHTPTTRPDGGSNSRKALAKRMGRIPDPTVCGNYNKKGISPKSGNGLATWVQQFPTPVANDGASPKRTTPIKGGMPLREFVQKWPTAPEEARVMGAGNGGTLNPRWVEWLMGFPIGWTDLEPLETVKYPSVPQLPGQSLEVESER